MQVGIVQLRSGSDRKGNLERFLDGVRAAAAGGAELVVGPEAVQHEFASPTTDLTGVAEPLDGPFVGALAGVAATTGVVVMAGMFECHPSGQRVYNTVVAVGPGGLLGAYRKLHLYDALGWRESDRVAPGDPGAGAVAVAVGDAVVGIMTCYDLRFPEMARVLAERGATAIAVPAAWVAGPGKAEQWDVLVRARAIENTLYVLAAAQPEPGYTGHSMLVDPAGEVVGALGGTADGCPEGLLIGQLAAERVAAVRESMPVLAHRRFVVKAAPAEGAGGCPERDSNPHALAGKGF